MDIQIWSHILSICSAGTSCTHILQTLTHIYEIGEKSPQQLEDNNNECDHNNLVMVAHKVMDHHLPSSQTAVTSCHDHPLTSSAPEGGCRYVYKIVCPKSG
jgi:hypothetical protein